MKPRNVGRKVWETAENRNNLNLNIIMTKFIEITIENKTHIVLNIDNIALIKQIDANIELYLLTKNEDGTIKLSLK
jgi:hypothetical protein